MNKNELRKNTINLLTEITDEKRIEIERKIEANLLEQKYWQESSIIGMTISQDLEWDTRGIIEAAWRQGKKVAVPKCLPETKQMNFYIIDSFNDLELAHFNLMEPIPSKTKIIDKNQIDLLVVPGLLFDKKGYRIGFGGGYYDRFLMDFSNKTVSIGSTYQLKDKVPVEEYDLPVQHIITELGEITVSGGE